MVIKCINLIQIKKYFIKNIKELNKVFEYDSKYKKLNTIKNLTNYFKKTKIIYDSL